MEFKVSVKNTLGRTHTNKGNNKQEWKEEKEGPYAYPYKQMKIYNWNPDRPIDFGLMKPKVGLPFSESEKFVI